MSELFKLIDDLSLLKKNLWESEPELHGSYSPFHVNRHFSLFQETVFEAQEMNKLAHLPNDLQYKFYLHALPKRRRMTRWPVAENKEALAAISRYFQVNINKSRSIFQVLTSEQVEAIQEKFKGQ